MAFWGPLLASVGGALAGSLVTSSASKAEASRNRKFQEDMSRTAHQREVKDLRAAGLNPILSAGGGGASTPSGAMGTISDIGQAVTGGVNTAIANRAMQANVRSTTATAETKEVDAKMAKDMFKFYNSNSALKKSVLSGMLSRVSNVRGEIGAGIGAATSAVGKLNERISQGIEWLSKKEKIDYSSPNRKVIWDNQNKKWIRNPKYRR